MTRNPQTTTVACELDLLEAMRHMIRGYDVHSRRLLSSSTVTLAQMLCLRALDDIGASTARQLSARLHLSASTMVGILDRMEGKGLIHRERDAADRRRVVVAITTEGRSVMDRTSPPLGDDLRRHVERLDRAGQEALVASLRLLADLIEPDAPAAG